jgi:phosphatidylglycerophosphate synthase
MADWNAGHLEERAARQAHRTLSLDAYAVTMLVAVLLVAGMHFFGDLLGMDTVAAGTAFVIYAIISAIALGNLHTHGFGRFGLANVVTTVRAAITALMGGLVLVPGDLGAGLHNDALWTLAVVVALALILDGVDGYLARKTHRASAFGARFDMEVDALLIFFLSLSAFELDKAGIWVLAIGLMRYAYVIAQAMFPVLQGELPQSFRRKAICVVQGVALCLLLIPIVLPPVSTWIAAIALASLSYSFAVDVIHLLQAGHRGQAAPSEGR